MQNNSVVTTYTTYDDQIKKCLELVEKSSKNVNDCVKNAEECVKIARDLYNRTYQYEDKYRLALAISSISVVCNIVFAILMYIHW